MQLPFKNLLGVYNPGSGLKCISPCLADISALKLCVGRASQIAYNTALQDWLMKRGYIGIRKFSKNWHDIIIKFAGFSLYCQWVSIKLFLSQILDFGIKAASWKQWNFETLQKQVLGEGGNVAVLIQIKQVNATFRNYISYAGFILNDLSHDFKVTEV